MSNNWSSKDIDRIHENKILKFITKLTCNIFGHKFDSGRNASWINCYGKGDVGLSFMCIRCFDYMKIGSKEDAEKEGLL